MNRDDRLQFCRRCQHQHFDREKGLLCGLTMQAADFEDSCPDFVEKKEKPGGSAPLGSEKEVNFFWFAMVIYIIGIFPFILWSFLYWLDFETIRMKWKLVLANNFLLFTLVPPVLMSPFLIGAFINGYQAKLYYQQSLPEKAKNLAFMARNLSLIAFGIFILIWLLYFIF